MIENRFSFAPNISWLFPELPFDERPRAAALAGFSTIEFGFPSHANLAALKSAQEDYGLKVVLFNLDVPVWDRLNRGYLADPDRREEFHRRLDEALEIARQLKVAKIMLPAGVEVDGLEYHEQQDCMIENLLYAAPLAASANLVLTIEALNPIDNPGYFLTTSRKGFEIVRAVNHPSIKFQFDTYHIQRMEGNLSEKIVREIDWIGHIQYADLPGRHEPGTGEINFNNLNRTIQAAGYSDFIGLEYIPLATGAAALEWAPPELRSRIAFP